jgi:glycosyltransferase involved in cell wall biosynthesis
VRVLTCTVVHHPEDARILHRQARALVDAGHDLVYAAPFTARGVQPRDWVTAVDLPWAVGRRRGEALRAARREIGRLAPEVDVVLLHDPELLLAVAGLRRRLPPVVWDVHEDTGAALSLKSWLPAPLRPPVRAAVSTLERVAERSVHLLLAEPGYVDRFRRPHPVVPNYTTVPDEVAPPGADRVVYVGWLSRARGAQDLVAVAHRLAPHGVRTELVGPADATTRPLLEQAAAAGVLSWDGYLPNDEALGRLSGALAGLSLLHDEPNYRHSMPTKVLEYMARGVPVVSTPLPRAVELVHGHDCGEVVPFGDAIAAADAVLRLRDDAARRTALGARGHAAARQHYHWPDAAKLFVGQLEEWAGSVR